VWGKEARVAVLPALGDRHTGITNIFPQFLSFSFLSFSSRIPRNEREALQP
jgi:hypothetical protein